MDDLEVRFVEGIQAGDDYLNVLNWYRNLYHTENPNTERGIMARMINDLFMAMKQGTAEELFRLKAKEG